VIGPDDTLPRGVSGTIVAMGDQPRIAVVGSTMIDLIAYTARVPHAGETIQGDDFQLGFGGKGANQAVLARLPGAEIDRSGAKRGRPNPTDHPIT
jgi:hypothetical protein